MAITTKTGDEGRTSLFGGVRVDKDNIRIECNGLIDELNSRIGMVRVHLPNDGVWHEKLHKIQNYLMIIMSHIATIPESPKENKRPHPTDCTLFCEHWIEELIKEMGDEKLAFLLPGGNIISANCHLARTAVRTAERYLVTLNKAEKLPDYILVFFNRLSDLFYLLATVELKRADIKPDKFMLFPSQKQ